MELDKTRYLLLVETEGRIMTIGFGRFEEDEARAIVKACLQAIQEAAPDDREERLKAIERTHSEAGHKWKNLPADEVPPRYCYFWATLYDLQYVQIVPFTFHHINRHHALSPDGWGMMSSRWIGCIDGEGVARIYKEA